MQLAASSDRSSPRSSTVATGRTALMIQPLAPWQPQGQPWSPSFPCRRAPGIWSGARQGHQRPAGARDSTAPVRTVIVGVVDQVEVAAGGAVQA
jgi:hypothetical protein